MVESNKVIKTFAENPLSKLVGSNLRIQTKHNLSYYAYNIKDEEQTKLNQWISEA